MICIVDLGIGNIGSVSRALTYLKVEHELTSDLSKIAAADKILLPGVGSFSTAAKSLEQKSLKPLLRQKVLEQKTPLLGICLGMQLLMEKGFEGGVSEGLGLIQGEVRELRVDRSKYSVPHMGWNDVHSGSLKMFAQLPENSCFYFVHSFEVISQDPQAQVAYTDYGGEKVSAAIEKQHIWGAQFHPEKSQEVGLHILKNFVSYHA